MKRLLLVTVASLIGIVVLANRHDTQTTTPASAAPTQSESLFKWVVELDPAPGCRTREQMDKIVRFSVNKDYLAMSAVWNTCRELHRGTEVVVEENPLFSDNLCVRIIGEVDCLWTNKNVVKRVPR
jgi:hypothetical protein